MGLSDLQDISTDYENIHFGLSDKDIQKLILDTVIGVLEILDVNNNNLDTKVDELEARVEALEG